MLVALTRSSESAIRLLGAAGGAFAVWLVIVGLLAFATRPRQADAGPATMDFGGDEPPAVVNFLTNRYEVGREAVAATLLDLAARRVVTIDQVNPEQSVVRLRTASGTTLTPYEEQVLDHVRHLASDGVVPCEALSTGPEGDSERWWKRFSKAVVDDARSRGLCRSRWSRAVTVLLVATAIVPAALGGLAAATAPDTKSSSSSSSDENDPVGTFFAVGAVLLTLELAIPFRLRAQRHTAAGRTAAATWLGLREYLHEAGQFADLPPASVAIWDRYLSYGAAMGVAAGAVRALPLGAESDRVAWSAYGGRWHVVRVRYPTKLPPGWGTHPALAVLRGGAILAAMALVATRLGSPLVDAIDGLHLGRDGWDARSLGIAGGIAVVGSGLALLALRSAVMFLVAVPDLFQRRVVEGVVVRVRGQHMAVDDGVHRRVRAWIVLPKVLHPGPGALVRVRVSPRLGHVFAVEGLGRGGAGVAQPAVAGEGLVAAGGGVPVAAPTVARPRPDLDLDAVAAATGVHLSEMGTGTAAPPVPGHVGSWTLGDGSPGQVWAVVSDRDARQAAQAGQGTGTSGLLGGMLLRQLTRLGGFVPVPGIGEEAMWAEKRNLLSAHDGTSQVTVMVGLENLGPERRLDLARTIAAQLLAAGGRQARP